MTEKVQFSWGLCGLHSHTALRGGPRKWIWEEEITLWERKNAAIWCLREGNVCRGGVHHLQPSKCCWFCPTAFALSSCWLKASLLLTAYGRLLWSHTPYTTAHSLKGALCGGLLRRETVVTSEPLECISEKSRCSTEGHSLWSWWGWVRGWTRWSQRSLPTLTILRFMSEVQANAEQDTIAISLYDSLFTAACFCLLLIKPQSMCQICTETLHT